MDTPETIVFHGTDIPNYDQIINCMRCGLCLAHCPTYNEEGIERSSPRGRIALIRAVADGKLSITDRLIDEMYFCLECRACESACPAGVKMGYLMEAMRAQIERHREHTLFYRMVTECFLSRIFPYGRRLKLATLPILLYQRLGLRGLLRKTGLLCWLPWHMGDLEELLPTLPVRSFLDEEIPAAGERKHRIGFFSGCMMNILFAEVNRSTARVLTRNGCEVVTPRDQVCCGALHTLIGEMDKARELARRNIEIFEKAEVEWIVTNCAGCGAILKDYGHLLKDDPEYAERAGRFGEQVRDISEWMIQLPMKPPTREIRARVTYDEPCHLLHGQGIREAPRALLRSIPGLELVELKESDWCCGSAGIYNVTNYEFSMELLDRKMDHLAETGAGIVATGNPGCMLQIALGTKRRRMNVRVAHPISLLDEAYEDAGSIS